MDNFNLPRLLTDAEVATIKAGRAAEAAIYMAANWNLPTPDAREVSALGDKGESYVNDGLDILRANQAELGAFIPLDKFENADALHDQAQELEDSLLENLTAPHNVSLIAGAAAKKFTDDEYVLVKGMERLNTKWKADVARLAARYKGQGKRNDLPQK